MATVSTIQTWTVGRVHPKPTVSAQPNPEIMIELEALTIVNVGKGHYMPGQRFFVAPARAEELVEAELAKKVGTDDVPKEARADDGAYAEEPATDLATDLTRVKEKAEVPIEEEVSAISQQEAHADNKAIDAAEAAKDDEKTGVKEDKTTAKTKEDKTVTTEKTK